MYHPARGADGTNNQDTYQKMQTRSFFTVEAAQMHDTYIIQSFWLFYTVRLTQVNMYRLEFPVYGLALLYTRTLAW